MKNDGLLKLLELKIGQEAARVAMRNRYNMVILSAIALIGVAILHAVPLEIYWTVAGGFAAVAFTSLAVAIYAKIKLAKLISHHQKTRVTWYSVPDVLPIQIFEKWLEGLNKKSRE